MLTSTRTEGGCVSEPLARSPILCTPPVTVLAGWQVSGRRSTADLTITDCSPAGKVQLRAMPGGAAAAVGVPFGPASRDGDGTLVVRLGPRGWPMIRSPAQGTA